MYIIVLIFYNLNSKYIYTHFEYCLMNVTFFRVYFESSKMSNKEVIKIKLLNIWSDPVFFAFFFFERRVGTD